MPVNITDVSAFTDPITAPAGADVANAASVVDPVQKLANRTRYLYNRVTPVSRPIYLYATAAMRQDPTKWTQIAEPTVEGRLKATGDKARIRWTLSPGSNFPWKGTITQILVNVTPSENRSALSGDPNDYSHVYVYKVQVDGTIALATSKADNGTAVYQSITMPNTGSLGLAFNGDTSNTSNINQIIVIWEAGNGITAPGVPNDLVDFLRIAVDVDQL